MGYIPGFVIDFPPQICCFMGISPNKGGLSFIAVWCGNHMSKIDSGFLVAHWDGAHIGIVPSVRATGILGIIFTLALSSGLVWQTAVEFHVRYLNFSLSKPTFITDMSRR